MISYSQNFEDVILNRCFKNKKTGFYIDIGASHPEICSITKHFYNKGWCGINVEPQKDKVALFMKHRERDINLLFAVSDKIGLQNFYQGEEFAFGLSTLSSKHADKLKDNGLKYKERIVPLVTLDQIIDQNSVRECDFINIDCEGSEKSVLLGWTNKHFSPSIIVIEAVEPMVTANDKRVEVHEEWEYLILEKDYRFVYADGINRFYLHNSHINLIDNFKFPPNSLDAFQVVNSEHYSRAYQEMRMDGFSARPRSLANTLKQYQIRINEVIKKLCN